MLQVIHIKYNKLKLVLLVSFISKPIGRVFSPFENSLKDLTGDRIHDQCHFTPRLFRNPWVKRQFSCVPSLLHLCNRGKIYSAFEVKCIFYSSDIYESFIDQIY